MPHRRWVTIFKVNDFELELMPEENFVKENYALCCIEFLGNKYNDVWVNVNEFDDIGDLEEIEIFKDEREIEGARLN